MYVARYRRPSLCDTYNSVKTSLQEELNQLTTQPKDSLAQNKLVTPNKNSSTAELASELELDEEDSNVYNPPVSITKGRKKNKRPQSVLKSKAKTRGNKCSKCGERGYNKAICLKAPV